MRCNEFRARLEQSLDDRLDPEMDWLLTSHAEDCDACRSELSGQQLLTEAMDLFEQPELPDSFAEQVVAVAALRPQPSRRRNSGALRILGVALAASLLVGFGFFNNGSWPDHSSNQVSKLSDTAVAPRDARQVAVPEAESDLNREQLTESVGPSAEEVDPQSFVSMDLFTLRPIDSDQIPGVRPLRTSLDVTISLLKQTIPGRGSSPPKQPATSQNATVHCYTV